MLCSDKNFILIYLFLLQTNEKKIKLKKCVLLNRRFVPFITCSILDDNYF